MVFYCKLFLKQDGIKSTQFYEIEIDESLFPLSKNLINHIKETQDKIETTNMLPFIRKLNNSESSYLLLSDTSNTNSSNSLTTSTQNPPNYKKLTKKSLFPIFF